MTKHMILDCTCDIVTGEVRIVLAKFGETEITAARLLINLTAIDLETEVDRDKFILHGHLTGDIDISAQWILMIFEPNNEPENRLLFPNWLPECAPNTSGVILSVCIPTFNRSKRCLEAVNSILASSSQNIEIVVRDNASTDDTQDVISNIKDPRLMYYRNSNNIGPIRNFNLALHSGRGKYVLLHSDEDMISVDRIDDFLSFLEQNPEISCGVASVSGSVIFRETRIFARGREALISSSGPFTYLGGFFYRRADLDIKPLFAEYSNPAYLYPFENLLWTHALKGHFAQYAPQLVVRGKNDKSYFPRLDGRHFNHPSNLIDQLLYRRRIFSHISENVLTENEVATALHNYEQAMLRQNFILAYDVTTADKFEIIAKLAKFAPNLSNSHIVKSLKYFAVAEEFFSSEDYQFSIHLASRASEEDEKNMPALLLLAEAFRLSCDPEREAQTYTRIIDTAIRHWSILVRLFNEFVKRGRPDDARKIGSLMELPEARTPDYLLKDIRTRSAALSARSKS